MLTNRYEETRSKSWRKHAREMLYTAGKVNEKMRRGAKRSRGNEGETQYLGKEGDQRV